MLDRAKSEESISPSLLCIDSQSVKLTPMIYENRGIDNNKKVNGRKRQIFLDPEGRLLRTYVHPANLHDGPVGSELLNNAKSFDKHLSKFWVMTPYKGVLLKRLSSCGLILSGHLYPKVLNDLW
jgi:hypothetical protein